MPVSLVDYTSLIEDEYTLGLYENLYRMSDIVKLFPVVEVGSLTVRGERWETLPSHAYRKLNDSFTDTTGTTAPVEDRLAIVGGEFKVDKVYEKLTDPLLRDPVDLQFDMHNKALERKIANDVFNGDIDSDEDSFDGLWKRFTSLDFPASQQIRANDAAGAELHVHADQASARKFFEKLDEALYQAGLRGAPPEGTAPGALFMNKTTFLGFQKAAVLANLSVYVKDLLGFSWYTYRGLPLVDVGLQRDRSTDIILDTYDPGDGGSDSSRIYVCRFAEPDGVIESPGSDGLVIVQAGSYEALGPEEYLTYEKWGIQWVLGIAHVGDDYCAAVLRDFEMAAS
jgi:hypothetical protein